MRKILSVVLAAILFTINNANAENIVGPCKYSISAFAENAAVCTISAKADNASPDLSTARELVCAKLSEKYVKGTDGTLWMYSSNYVIAFKGGRTVLVIRSPSGMKNISGLPDISRIETPRYAVIVTKSGLSSPLLYDFEVN